MTHSLDPAALATGASWPQGWNFFPSYLGPAIVFALVNMIVTIGAALEMGRRGSGGKRAVAAGTRT